eukprot:5722673-Prymnesium_polylepis.1
MASRVSCIDAGATSSPRVLQNATAQETSIESTFTTAQHTTAQNLKKARSGKRKTKEEMVAPFAQEIKELKDLA